MSQLVGLRGGGRRQHFVLVVQLQCPVLFATCRALLVPLCVGRRKTGVQNHCRNQKHVYACIGGCGLLCVCVCVCTLVIVSVCISQVDPEISNATHSASFSHMLSHLSLDARI